MLSGPGNGAVIQDYMKIGGHFPPPEGSDNLDPYAYDIYSLGQTMQTTCRVRDLIISSLILSSLHPRNHAPDGEMGQ